MTDAWHAQVSQIYKQYDVYSQGDGAEQLSFNAETGANRARSSVIVKWLDTKTHLNSHGNVLDIGCGNGCFLKAFYAKYQDWTLAGVDLDDRYRINIESISDSSTFHSGKLEELDDKYDLIVMIHSLEHIPYPVNFLKQLKSLMKPSGLLLLEVPDLANSPFDLIIADHCTHFSVNSLTNLVESAGFRVSQVDNNCVSKEITLIAINDIIIKCPPPPPNCFSTDNNYLDCHLAYLEELLNQSQQSTGGCGIFGSSISATWLAEALQTRLEFFVDEDPNRIGKVHLGKPIININSIPINCPILMPMRRDVASLIANRLSPAQVRFILPPPLINK